MSSAGWQGWLPLWRSHIERAAAEHAIEPVKLAAVVWQESNGGVRLLPGDGLVYHPRFLYRYEPRYWDRYCGPTSKSWPEYAPPKGCEGGPLLETWKRRIAASYGLCQIMYPTAVWLLGAGAEPFEPEELLDPGWSCELGARLLRLHLRQGLSWRDALAAYNTGRRDHERTQYDDQVIAKEEALRSAGAFGG